MRGRPCFNSRPVRRRQQRASRRSILTTFPREWLSTESETVSLDTSRGSRHEQTRADTSSASADVVSEASPAGCSTCFGLWSSCSSWSRFEWLDSSSVSGKRWGVFTNKSKSCVCIAQLSSVPKQKEKSPCVYLQLIEAEREVEDLCKLFGQGLLPLQVLHGGVRRAGQRLQQTSQGIFCRHIAEISIYWNQNVLISDYGWTVLAGNLLLGNPLV